MQKILEIVKMSVEEGFEFTTVLRDMASFDDAPLHMQPVLYLLQAALDDWQPCGMSTYPIIMYGVGAVYYSSVYKTLTYMVDEEYLK